MPQNNRFFCLHTHFYQPPRENPWTGKIPPQPSAYPFENWNLRIARECYLPNACARINRGDGKALAFVNNYSYFNFNFGPTLLSWYEKAFPSYYNLLIEAGRKSREERGHSSAIAQGYNHIIMPLASFQDRLTQAIWGIDDFTRRFGFMPEAMWLPEAAVDENTLRLMIDLGMKYVILSPYQIQAVKEAGSSKWTDVSNGHFNTRRPYLWRDDQPGAKNRSIAVFVYDGPLSKAAAFEGLLSSSSALAERIQACFTESDENQLVSMAVDGETFGHHHKYAEMTIAYAFSQELKDRGIQVVNYGEYLEKNPPQAEVLIKEGPDGDGTSWSCAHGIRRWKGGCTCGTENGDSAEWRKPLRQALNLLRDNAAEVYSKEAAKYFTLPWKARNKALMAILGASTESRKQFFDEQASHQLSETEKATALRLLEMQKNSMYMFTSCGWFFSDVSRIETVQNLRYAARVFEALKGFDNFTVEKTFLSLLDEAKSNYAGEGSAKDIFLRILRDNNKAIEKNAALLVAEKLFFDSPEKENDEQVLVKKRKNISETLEVCGEIKNVCNYDCGNLAFAYQRNGEKFPKMFFATSNKYAEIEQALLAESPLETENKLQAIHGIVKIVFDDFSPEEKNRYALLLAAAIRENHAADTSDILKDYLYLLGQLPEKDLSSWAPLRAQAADYAKQTAEIMFRKTARTTSEDNIIHLVKLAESIHEAGIKTVFEPAPEAELALARSVAIPVLENMNIKNLSLFHQVLKAARLLNASHMIFYMQNFFYEILRKCEKEAHGIGIPAMLEAIRQDADMELIFRNSD